MMISLKPTIWSYFWKKIPKDDVKRLFHRMRKEQAMEVKATEMRI
jgi:hypothetical protein